MAEDRARLPFEERAGGAQAKTRRDPLTVARNVARALPRQLMHEWKVVPVRISAGTLFLASPEIPTDELSNTLRGFTRLEPRFQLVTPANFAELAEALL